MIKINYLKVEIQTEKGLYGFESEFNHGLNIIASNDNTKGKSSVLSAIYYSLGLEEIIGGKGSKSLSQAYKISLINEDGENINVLESRIFLEITNGKDTITLLRYVKSDTINDKLIRVYHSKYKDCFQTNTVIEDYYVNTQNAATHDKGFHSFLEKFIGLSLPIVPANEGNRKLYLQLVFSLLFIEQKHGWGGIMAGMPIYNISDPKKRVMEYTLALNTLKNEIEKKRLDAEYLSIKQKWEDLYKFLLDLSAENQVSFLNYPTEMKIITKEEISSICFKKEDKDLSKYIEELQIFVRNELNTTQRINENNLEFETKQLLETQKSIVEKDESLKLKRQELEQQQIITNKHKGMLETIIKDIENNKDAKKLKELGSELAIKSLSNICPTCGQIVSDSLLHTHMTMSIDENIEHLEAQKRLYEFTLASQNQAIKQMTIDVQNCEQELLSLRKLERVLKEDVVKVKNDISEVVVYQKFKINSEIDNYNRINAILDEKKDILESLSKQYSKYLKDKSKLPSDKLEEIDNKKLKLLQNKFIDYLQIFRYNSINDIKVIEISKLTYLPMSNGFDMKYDTSASDEIRAIWAFILAINEVDKVYNSNFCGLLIFDEPKQQSIVDEDFKCFINEIIKNFQNKQVIVAATIKDIGTKKVIDDLDSDTYKLIELGTRAFKKL